MQFVQFTAARDDTGQVLKYAVVTVYLTGTTTKAALFNAAGASLANPVTADATGLVGLAAANGTYDAKITSADGLYTSPGMLKLQIFDVAAVAQALASGTVAGLVSKVKDTLANLNADLAAAANTLGLVYADGTASNNDLYVKIGASGSGSWTGPLGIVSNQIAASVSSATASATAAAGSATSAAGSASAAAGSASAASTSASNASSSASAAASSAASAGAHDSSAAFWATNASSSADTASAAGTAAGISATAAANSAANAATSASAASADRTAADSSKTAAQTAEAGTIAAIAGAGGIVGTVIIQAASRSILAATASPTAGLAAVLSEAGREGIFIFDNSNLSAAVTADTNQGIYVAPSTPSGLATNGSAGAWTRKWNGDLSPEMFGATGNGIAADNAKITAALVYGDVRLSVGKTYGLSGPILVPSGRTLRMNGATVKILAGFTAISGINACIGSASGTVAPVILGPGTLDANKIGVGGTRLNGFMFYQTAKFLAQGPFTVQNCSGYGNFAQDGAFLGQCSGTFRNITTKNCQIHYEAMGVDGVLFENIRSEDGDNDIGGCQSYLHPLSAAKNVTYRNFRGSGAVASVVEMTSNVGPMDQIHFDDCVGASTNGGIGFVSNGSFGTTNLLITNSDFESTTYIATNVAFASGKMVNSRFVGIQECLILTGGSHWELHNCDLIATATGGANPIALETDSTSLARITGGLVSASGGGGGLLPQGPIGTIFISQETVLVPFGKGKHFEFCAVSDTVSNSTSGTILDSASGVPWSFPVEAGRHYRIQFRATFNHPTSSAAVFAIAGGALGTLRGMLAMGTNTNSQAVVAIASTSIGGMGDSSAEARATPAGGSPFWLPVWGDLVLSCTAAGTISIQTGTGNSVDQMFVAGPYVLEVREI